jgi:hypothetical protein
MEEKIQELKMASRYLREFPKYLSGEKLKSLNH